MMRLTTAVLVVLAAFLTWPVYSQEPTMQSQVVFVPASSEEATAPVRLTGIDKPVENDFKAGALANEQYPNQRILPELSFVGVPSGAGKDWDVAKVHAR